MGERTPVLIGHVENLLMIVVDQLSGQPNETGPARAGTMAPMTGPTPVLPLHLDGVHDKDGFLERCARDLRFPDWYGHNWDALADCLTDLSWWGEGAAPSGYLLRVRGWTAFRDAAPEAAAIAADILSDAVTYWSARGTPLTIWYDDGPDT